MVIGHSETIEELKRLAKADKLSHGYIFHGPSMVGKRTLAGAFANFLETGNFDTLSEAQAPLQDSKIIDIAFMKALDANTKDSIGIDAVREIKNFLWQKPAVSERRTLIIDEAELLTTEAQNALLKVTEEPPTSALLILITSDVESILPTITSRLPKIYFGAVPESEINEWFSAQTNATPKGKSKLKAVSKTAAKGIDKGVIERAMGKPGLAWRLLNDKDFRNDLEVAENFLKTSATGRKEAIKKIIDPDDFNLRNFLDAVIITLAWEKPSKAKAELWHKALLLQQNATDFGLNPRLQLESLMRN